MIKIPSFAGFNYTKESYQNFVDALNLIDGWTVENLGKSSDENYNLYGCSYGNLISKPTIYLQGQVHGGHEWRTAWWVKKFMETISNPSLFPAQATILHDLKARFSFYCIPLINPYGYVNTAYYNANGVSISENFDYLWENGSADPESPYYRGDAPWSEPEAVIVRDTILNVSPISVVCTHTYGGFNGVTTRKPVNNRRDIAKSIADYFKSNLITSGVKVSGGSSLATYYNSSAIYQWASQQTNKHGKKIYAHVLETGSSETENEQARLGLNGLLLYCIYAANYYENNSLIVDEYY